LSTHITAVPLTFVIVVARGAVGAVAAGHRRAVAQQTMALLAQGRTTALAVNLVAASATAVETNSTT